MISRFSRSFVVLSVVYVVSPACSLTSLAPINGNVRVILLNLYQKDMNGRLTYDEFMSLVQRLSLWQVSVISTQVCLCLYAFISVSSLSAVRGVRRGRI